MESPVAPSQEVIMGAVQTLMASLPPQTQSASSVMLKGGSAGRTFW